MQFADTAGYLSHFGSLPIWLQSCAVVMLQFWVFALRGLLEPSVLTFKPACAAFVRVEARRLALAKCIDFERASMEGAHLDARNSNRAEQEGSDPSNDTGWRVGKESANLQRNSMICYM